MIITKLNSIRNNMSITSTKRTEYFCSAAAQENTQGPSFNLLQLPTELFHRVLEYMNPKEARGLIESCREINKKTSIYAQKTSTYWKMLTA